MPSTRSGASYTPSSSSQKGNRRDYGRSQPGTEEKGLVDDFQTAKIGHSDADNTILPSQRMTPSQEASVDIYKARHKATTIPCSTRSIRSLQICGKNASILT
ncbi:hypothetical protein O181_126557 [Austropuccinia psidii MF-1]|uniref:Uncharacterized protein n=1 Tax=Austropuccinia psidii MF-1 TaxID=1389203 RepID=A0A9Q3KTL8_9BASI|nr:hypothetical protein [Austropuccinia psidii MF-1]